MNCIQRTCFRSCLVLSVLFLAISSQAQTAPSGRVNGIDPDHAYVLRLVSNVLQDRRTGLWGVESASNDLISNQEEFHAHLMTYRAHFRFHVDGNMLVVTMEDLQSPSGGTWVRSVIPADGAQAKLIAQIVDQLTALNQTYMAERKAQGMDVPSSAEVEHRPAKTLAFDAIPVRCAEGMCPVRRDGLWGFIDYDGNLVLDFKYRSPSTPSFMHGMCVVQAADSENRPLPGLVYIDKTGKVLFSGKRFESAGPFDGGLAVVSLPGVLDANSKMAALDLHGHAQRLSGVTPDAEFHEGMVIARDGATSKLGFRGSNMQWAIRPAYDDAEPFSDGLAWVEQRTPGGVAKWGAVDKSGKVVILFQFSVRPEPFSEGLAIVTCTNNSNFGYVDQTGSLVISCQFGSARPFFKGLAFVRREGRAQLIDKQGQTVSGGVSQDLLSELMPRDDGDYNFFHTQVQRLTGLLDERWNIVLPARYQSLGPYPADSDPKGLAWASSASPDAHEGFVDRNGEFVLIAEKSIF